MNYTKAKDYCVWAIDEQNNKVPKYVKYQCKLFLDIWDNNDELSFLIMIKQQRLKNAYTCKCSKG